MIEAPCFALQFDETTNITNDAQLIVYCRFPNKAVEKIVEHFLFCLSVGLQTTGEFIFSKFDEFFQHENLSWDKCVAVTTDGAAAMIGKHKMPLRSSSRGLQTVIFSTAFYIVKH